MCSSDLDYEEDYDPDGSDSDSDAGFKPFPDFEDDEDDSDDDIEYIDGDDDEDDEDDDDGSYYVEEELEDYDEDPDAPYMEITVNIGTNDPNDCQIVKSAEKIKQAIGIIFPNLPRLDMISKAKFFFRNLEDMRDEDGKSK